MFLNFHFLSRIPSKECFNSFFPVNIPKLLFSDSFCVSFKLGSEFLLYNNRKYNLNIKYFFSEFVFSKLGLKLK